MHAWILPLIVMASVWAWAILAPMPPSRGDYGFGQALSIFLRLVVCVIATLTVWLLYFMILSWRP